MYYILTYYLAGVLVSMYFIYYYRLSNKTKQEPSKNDGWLALIGPWVFPLQILKHIFRKKQKKTHLLSRSDALFLDSVRNGTSIHNFDFKRLIRDFIIFFILLHLVIYIVAMANGDTLTVFGVEIINSQ